MPSAGSIGEDAFVPITVVPSSEIVSTPGANLADSLQYRPGIAGSNFAAGANRPVIRGFDNYRVRVQENGIGSHDVSALSEDHAVPIDPFAADRIEVVRGPATLRYGSQAIGGVVNASNDRIPEIHPAARVQPSTTQGRPQLGGPGRRRRLQGDRRRRQFRRPCRCLQAPCRRLRHAGRPAIQLPLSTTRASRSAHRLSASDGFIGIAFSRYNSLYGIPGKDAVDTAAHRHGAGQVPVARRMARRRRRHRGDPLLVRHLGLRRTTKSISRPDRARSARCSRTRNTRAASRCSICLSRPRSASCAGAVGTQFGQRKTDGLKLRRRGFAARARCAHRHSRGASWFEELQVTKRLRLQAAAPHRADRCRRRRAGA